MSNNQTEVYSVVTLRGNIDRGEGEWCTKATLRVLLCVWYGLSGKCLRRVHDPPSNLCI